VETGKSIKAVELAVYQSFVDLKFHPVTSLAGHLYEMSCSLISN